MVALEVENLKALREALCVAQSAIGQAYGQRQSAYKKSKVNQIQKAIDQIDILRPLGSDGKHGNRHTEFCGCEDNPYLDLLNEWRIIPAFPMYEMSGRGYIRPIPHDAYWHDKEAEIWISAFEGEEIYSLWTNSQGFDQKLDISASALFKTTFPELKKEN